MGAGHNHGAANDGTAAVRDMGSIKRVLGLTALSFLSKLSAIPGPAVCRRWPTPLT
jgi:hypothetical protein